MMRFLYSCLFVLLSFTAVMTTAGAVEQSPAAAVSETSEQLLLSNVRQLIFQGNRSGEGYFSADGAKMVFQSEREPGNPFYQIYLMDLETGDVNRVSTGTGKTTCAWIHPRGNKVLFASSHADPRATAKQKEELEKRAAGKGSRYSWSFDEHYDIFEAAPNGQALRNLTETLGYDAEGSWSPDGRLIAFASNRHAYDRKLSPGEEKIFGHDKSYFMEIYIMNADGTGVRRLTDAPGYDGGPFFSPDGRKLVWRRFSEDGARAEVWTMNVDGTEQRQITRMGVMSWAPYFHPSGDYIIFTNNQHGFANFELYIVDSKGRSKPVRVTHTPGFDGLPVFTPDGQQLSWASSRTADRKAQIFMADWNDAGARKLLGLDATTQTTTRDGDQMAQATPRLSETSSAITPEDLRLHVDYLASEAMGGRLTGTEGEHLATEYVAAAFREFGLTPAGENGSFFQPFPFTAGVSLEPGNRLELKAPNESRAFVIDADWRPLAFSNTGQIGASEMVFAGYGIVAPATEQFSAYDAYGDLDVKDKWVMVLRYLPESISAERRQHLAPYFSLRFKAMLARDKGARGLIVVSGPNAEVKAQLIKLSFDTAVAATSIGVISVTDAVAQHLLKSAGKSLQALQDVLDTGEQPGAFPIPGLTLDAKIALKQERRAGRNVLARLPANSSTPNAAVAIGAHVDHIGNGVGFDSLASGDDVGRVHPGADDNASGVAALLEIAQYLSQLKAEGKLKLQRDVIFAAWSGEELGLLGSGHFVRTAQRDGELSRHIGAYLNMDMIGRLRQKLYLQGVGSSGAWAGEIEKRNAPLGLPILVQKDTYLSTDALSFYINGVPILNAFTGAHEDYNTPRDTADKLNYADAARIARFMALLSRALAQKDRAFDYVALEKPVGSPTRRSLRAYMGTIPEYGESDLKGVKLNGVAQGGPAQRAGLQAGDIIVELAGKRIESIYDYTYALNALKVGQPVVVVVLRARQTVRLLVTPASRE